MELASGQVASPIELSAVRHDNDNDKLVVDEYAKARRRQRSRQNERSGLNAAGFAYGRRNSILELMRMRFGGPCATDDAEVFADVLTPFIVEAATLHRHRDGSRRDPHVEAVACLGHALPAWTRANEEQLHDMITEAVERRAKAVELGAQWLPMMPELVGALRPTREEARRLRGWGCINPATPEERREADRLRKRAARAASGATPREESASARKPWEAAGISRASWYRRQRDSQLAAETGPSVPYLLDGTDGSVSPSDTDHDQLLKETFAFVGRVISLFPWELAALTAEYPDVMLILPVIDAQLASEGVEPCDVGDVSSHIQAWSAAATAAA